MAERNTDGGKSKQGTPEGASSPRERDVEGVYGGGTMPGPQGRPEKSDRVLGSAWSQGGQSGGEKPALDVSDVQPRPGRYYGAATARLSQPRERATGYEHTEGEGLNAGYSSSLSGRSFGTGRGTTGDMYGSRPPEEGSRSYTAPAPLPPPELREGEGREDYRAANGRSAWSAGDRFRAREPEFASFQREMRHPDEPDWNARSPRELGYGGQGTREESHHRRHHSALDVRVGEHEGGNVQGTGGMWREVDRQRGFFPSHRSETHRGDVPRSEAQRTEAQPGGRVEGRRRWQREPLTAREVMTRNPRSVRRDGTLREAAAIMKEENCGIVPVVDAASRLVGVLTDRDVVIRAFAADKSPEQCRVADVMTEDVECVTPDETVHDVVEMMGKKQIRRVPVVDRDDKLLGIIALGDIATRADYDDQLQEALERISSRRSFWSRIFG